MPKTKKVRKPRVIRSKRLRFRNPFASSGFDYPDLPDLYNALPAGVSSVEAYEDELDAARRVERENAKIVVGKDAVRRDIARQEKRRKWFETLKKTGFPKGYTEAQLRESFKLSDAQFAEILAITQRKDPNFKFSTYDPYTNPGVEGSGFPLPGAHALKSLGEYVKKLKSKATFVGEAIREKKQREAEKNGGFSIPSDVENATREAMKKFQSRAPILAEALRKKIVGLKKGGSDRMKKKRIKDIIMRYQDIPSEYSEGELGRRFDLNQRDFNLINSLSNPVGGRALIGWQAAQPYALLKPLELTPIGWVPPSKDQNDSQKHKLSSRQKKFSDDFLTLHGVIPDSETVKDAFPDIVEPFTL